MLSSVANNITTLCRDGQASDVLYTPFCLHAKFIAARHSAFGWRFLSDEARKQRSSEQLRDYLNARHDLPDAYGIDRESRHVADDDRRAIILRTPSPTFATAVARMAGIEHQSDVKGEASFAQRLSRKIQ